MTRPANLYWELEVPFSFPEPSLADDGYQSTQQVMMESRFTQNHLSEETLVCLAMGSLLSTAHRLSYILCGVKTAGWCNKDV